MAEQLAQLGAPAEILAAWTAEEAATEVGVLECNWVAVQVYRQCEWTIAVGMSSVRSVGISARELRAALSLCRVRPGAWDDAISRVRWIEHCARPLLNQSREKPLPVGGTRR